MTLESKARIVGRLLGKSIKKLKKTKQLKSTLQRIRQHRQSRVERLFATSPHKSISHQKLSKSVLGVRHSLREAVEDRHAADRMLFEKEGVLRTPAAKYFKRMASSGELSKFREAYTDPLRQRSRLLKEIKRQRKQLGPKSTREHYRKIAERFKHLYF